MNNHELTNQTHPLITPDHLRRQAVVYCRQSTERQVLQNTGSTQYQRSLVEIAREFGWEDSQIITIDEDLGRSGSTTQGRTGWERLQEMIDADLVGAVFVANIGRLARQVYDFEVFRIRAALHKTLLYSDGRLADPTNSNDTIVSQLMAMVASFENRKRTELMTQSRLAKAKRGEAVSRLPVGWIKGPDGRFDYDPATKDTIRTIIDTFWQTRSVRQTVKTLIKAGIEIPCKKRGERILFNRPTLGRVRFILTDPAYAGCYVYQKTQAQPGGPILASGQSARVPVSEEHWIKNFNHHPAYLTLEEQEEIKSILAKNHFTRRYRVGRGRALIQGLLRCGVCGATLSVSYPSKGYVYSCSRARRYGEKPCVSFSSYDLEHCILREVFKVLKTPPIEMLKSALEGARKKKQTRKSWIGSERERLAHEESIARERADISLGRYPSVYFDALEKLEKVLQDKKEFEQKIALEPAAPPHEQSEDELKELCRIASEVPTLWHHEAMTHQGRKEILRCLIDHIVVAVTDEKIEAAIVWKAGGQTPLLVWRRRGRHHLIRELHAQKLTAAEIKEHLAAGNTSTGQVVNIGLERLYFKMHALGLKQHRFPDEYRNVQQKAAELYREGCSGEWIAQHFKEQGFTSASGKPWTALMVYGVVRAIGASAQSLEDIHRRLIGEALARGLSHCEIAREFNERKIRQRGRPPWTERSVVNICRKLGLQCERAQKETTKTKAPDPAGLTRLAQHAPNNTAAAKRPSPTKRRYPPSRGCRNIESGRSSADGAKRGRRGRQKPTTLKTYRPNRVEDNDREKAGTDE